MVPGTTRLKCIPKLTDDMKRLLGEAGRLHLAEKLIDYGGSICQIHHPDGRYEVWINGEMVFDRPLVDDARDVA